MKISFMAPVRPVLFAAALSIAGLSAGLVRAQEAPPASPAANPPAAAPDTAKSDAPKKDAISADARAVIRQMAQAHKALKSYSGTLTFTVDETADKNGKKLTQVAQIAYQLPNKARATTKNPVTGADVMTVSDGTTLFQTVSTEKGDYHKAPAPKDARAIGQIIGAAKSGGAGLFPVLVSDPNAEAQVLPPGLITLVKNSDATMDGVVVDVLTATFGLTPDKPAILVFSIGKEDHLLRGLHFVQTGDGGKTITLDETYSGVQANPDLPASTFVFKPAPGAKVIVEKAAANTPPADLPYDARLKPGVKPLPFTGKDLAGLPVSLAAYKGKVILLDFWATWCPPCRDEVPNLVKNYNKYHAKGFEVVGVSLDRKDDKPKLVSYTKENKMPWRQVFDGGYWSAAMAKAYGVQAIPFSVLIGRDGKILAVGDNIRGAELEPAIQAALAGK